MSAGPRSRAAFAVASARSRSATLVRYAKFGGTLGAVVPAGDHRQLGVGAVPPVARHAGGLGEARARPHGAHHAVARALCAPDARLVLRAHLAPCAAGHGAAVKLRARALPLKAYSQ